MKHCFQISLIVVIACLIPNYSFAQKPIISISGSVDTTINASDNQSSAFKKDRLADAVINSSGDFDLNNSGTENNQNHDLDIVNDSKFQIKINQITDFDLKYGGVVELEADIATNQKQQDFDIDKAFIFAQNNYGKFEVGNNVGVNQTMKVGVSSFARGAGGVNGKYLEFINLPMLADSTSGINKIGGCDGFRVNSSGRITTSGTNCDKIKLPHFILTPQSPISHGGYAQSFYGKATDNDYNGKSASKNLGFNRVDDGSFGDLEDATKISYYSPRISGLQLGLTLTPNTKNSSKEYFIQNDDGDIKNIVSFGANYSDNFGNLDLGLSLTGEIGKFNENQANNIKRNDLKAYEIGVMAHYLGFTIGGSYGSWGDSLMPKTGIYSCDYDPSISIVNQDCQNGNGGIDYNNLTKNDEATYYTAGLAYQISSIALSVTHLTSQFQDNKYQATSFGIDYKIKKGLMPYFEVTKFDFESNQVQASDISNQIDKSTRQIKDNKGFIALVGLLFSF